MGFLVQNYTILVDGANELTPMAVGPGALFSLSAIVTEDTPTTNEMWIEIGVLSGGDGVDQRAAVLESAYAGTLNAVRWTGFLPIGDDSFVYARLNGQADDSIRLVAFISKDPTPPVSEVPRA